MALSHGVLQSLFEVQKSSLKANHIMKDSNVLVSRRYKPSKSGEEKYGSQICTLNMIQIVRRILLTFLKNSLAICFFLSTMNVNRKVI